MVHCGGKSQAHFIKPFAIVGLLSFAPIMQPPARVFKLKMFWSSGSKVNVVHFGARHLCHFTAPCHRCAEAG